MSSHQKPAGSQGDDVAAVARSGGIREYARHRNCSHGAVQKAVKTKRLNQSVGVVAGVVRVLDFTLADREWLDNTMHLKAGRRATPGRAAATGPAPVGVPVVERERLSVFAMKGAVFLIVTEPGDSETITCDVVLTPAVARVLGARLFTLAEEMLK